MDKSAKHCDASRLMNQKARHPFTKYPQPLYKIEVKLLLHLSDIPVNVFVSRYLRRRRNDNDLMQRKMKYSIQWGKGYCYLNSLKFLDKKCIFTLHMNQWRIAIFSTILK